MSEILPYNSYSRYMQSRFGFKIWRVGVDAGFSCPNRDCNRGGGCVYCDAMGAKAAYLRTEESGFNHSSKFEENLSKSANEDIEIQVSRGIEFLKRRYHAEHFALYFQSFSNTFAPVKRLKEIYDYALSLFDWDELIVSTRPDCIDRGKVELLKSYATEKRRVSVELGLQSGCDDLLKAMNRGHDVRCLVESAAMVRDAGLDLGLHILTGFPGEGEKQLQMTVDVINMVHPQNIKIHNLNIASGTVLYQNYLKGEVTVPCARRHIANTVYILRRIPADIVIERLICETPSHRLASPRQFPDKNTYLRRLEAFMNENAFKQGDLFI